MKPMIAVVLLGLSVLVLQPQLVLGASNIVELSVEAEFDDVSIDVEKAIANRGFVVDFKANIGEMLTRTATDVGSTKTIYRNAVTWQFCSALLSRKMMEIDASNIAYCPYVVFAYETVAGAGTVVVGYLRKDGKENDAASRQAVSEVDTHLQAIISEATE